jgi:hypothetical protein
MGPQPLAGPGSARESLGETTLPSAIAYLCRMGPCRAEYGSVKGGGEETQRAIEACGICDECW